MQDWKKRGGLVRGARYTAEFEDVEIHVMDSLALSVSTVLRQRRDSAPQDPLAEIAGMHTGHTQTPEDPALARLLPDFELPEHQQFPGEQELMRSMNEYDIITSKYDNIMVLLELCQVGPVWTVDETQALAIIGALNDIRLFFAAAEIDDRAEGIRKEELIEWLAYNQQSLLRAVTGYDD